MTKKKKDDLIGEENLKKGTKPLEKRETGISEETKKKIWKVLFIVLIGTLATTGITFFAQALAFDALQPSNTSDGTWDVAFVEMEEISRTGNAAELEAPSFNNLKATFHVTLNSPGDEIKYSLTIANRGSIDAKLDGINIVPPNKDDDPFLYYVDNIHVGDYLNVGERTKMTLTIKYNDKYTGTDMPKKDAEVILFYVQK